MPDIITVTLNPALDMSTETARVAPGPKLRCAAPRIDPGGGGVNVSRAIAVLGGRSLALLATGGATGQELCHLLDLQGIPTCRFEMAQATRQSLAVTETETGQQFRFVLPGPDWTAEDETRLLKMVAGILRPGQTLVLSGSQPPGIALDFGARLNDLGGSVGARLAVDTSGAAQRWLVEHPQNLWLMRMDAAEAEELLARPLPERVDTAAAARELVQAGVAEIVIIGRGADGSVLACAQGCFHSRCDVERILSKVGAGDSLTAAVVLALTRGADPAEALRHGVAAASAAVMTGATELCRAADVEALLPSASLSTLQL